MSERKVDMSLNKETETPTYVFALIFQGRGNLKPFFFYIQVGLT